MSNLERALRSYYDDEAAGRADRPIDPRRVQRREEFVALVRSEGRSSLLEVGAGPGRDAAAFIAAGLHTVGIDLSLGPLLLARRDAVPVVQASVFALPIAARAFAAGWTMSTLVHVPDSRFHEAMASITATLKPGAPLAIGLWGGFDQEGIKESDHIQPPRFFSLRTHERARGMLETHGTIERFETWSGPANWEYQFAILRT